MKSALLLSFAALALTVSALRAGPLEDLASPSQPTRDAAAKSLRENFQPAPREKWQPVVDAIKPGDTKAAILERLKPFNVASEGGAGSGGSHSESYRLDDRWMLSCAFRNEGEKLIKHTLYEQLRAVWVAAPADFTGVWTTYFVNGQRSHEIHYEGGKYAGTFTAFHSNGAICYVQNYVDHIADGEDLGFFPSGRISYRALYRAGKPVGTWTWYNEDGTVRSTKEHPEK